MHEIQQYPIQMGQLLIKLKGVKWFFLLGRKWAEGVFYLREQSKDAKGCFEEFNGYAL